MTVPTMTTTPPMPETQVRKELDIREPVKTQFSGHANSAVRLALSIGESYPSRVTNKEFIKYGEADVPILAG